MFTMHGRQAMQLFLVMLCMSVVGCVNAQTRAWNHYETGMKLYFAGERPEEGKEDKIKKNYLAAIELNQKLPGVYASLGTYMAILGNYDAAKEYWAKEKKIHEVSEKAMDIALSDDVTMRIVDANTAGVTMSGESEANNTDENTADVKANTKIQIEDKIVCNAETSNDQLNGEHDSQEDLSENIQSEGGTV